MKTFFVSSIGLMFFAFIVESKLTGRWETKLKDGNILGAIFKPDQSLVWYLNKKPFVSGSYTQQNDTFTIKGNGCLEIKGVYKLNFYSNSDSLRFKVINDSCDERKKGIGENAFGKVK